MKFVAFLFMTAALYCLAAVLLELPAFKAAKAFRKTDRRKTGTVRIFLSDCAKALAKFVPLGMLKEIEIQKQLDAANMKIPPKEFMAEIILYGLLPLPLTVPAYLASPALAPLPALYAVYLVFHKYNDLSRLGDARKREIEKSLPAFVSYMANALKSSRRVLDILDAYRANYNTPLTEELAITVADMRTGNPEMALQHLGTRINSPFLSELVRGLLSAMQGNNMSGYFDNLGFELNREWERRLRLQSLKKKEKIKHMAYLVFGCAALTMLAALIVALKSVASQLTGLK